MDKETQQIYTEQKTIKTLVEVQEWSVARAKFVEKVLELQNAFDIDIASPDKMIIDLQARKMASSILFDFLKEIEGTVEMADQTAEVGKSYIVRGK